FEFRHALYRQGIYRRLPVLKRSTFHRSLGERLMPICAAGKRELTSELALHFEAAHDYERATQCLILAAENATSRFASRDSIRILQHALELVPELPAGAQPELEIQILQRIGDLHFSLGGISDSAASHQ